MLQFVINMNCVFGCLTKSTIVFLRLSFPFPQGDTNTASPANALLLFSPPGEPRRRAEKTLANSTIEDYRCRHNYPDFYLEQALRSGEEFVGEIRHFFGEELTLINMSPYQIPNKLINFSCDSLFWAFPCVISKDSFIHFFRACPFIHFPKSHSKGITQNLEIYPFIYFSFFPQNLKWFAFVWSLFLCLYFPSVLFLKAVSSFSHTQRALNESQKT